MKIVILGGCGSMGSSVARDLIKSDDVSRVILADKKIDMSHVHESVQSSKKVSTLTLDITDFQRLVNAIRGSDVVINDVGPYSKFGIQPAKAAIAAGVSYIDICDDCHVTKEIFELDESARKAGVSICTGFGGTPGITNIVAKYAANKLDEVDEIRIFWALSLNEDIGQAGLMQAMTQFMGNVIQYIDGSWVDVPAGSGGEEVMFIEPIGKSEVYYAAHPEPVTLPRYIPGVKTVIEKGGFLPSWVSRTFMELINLGFVSGESLILDNVSTTVKDVMASVAQHASGFWKQVQETQYTASPGIVVVKGKQGANTISYTYRLIGRAGPSTSIPTSICAQMLCCGDIQAKGVVAPEGAVDPEKFLSVLAKRGARFIEEKTIKQEIIL